MSKGTSFSRTGLIMVVLFGAVFLWLALDLLLLLFAGILLAIFLRSLSLWVTEHTPLTNGWALLAVVLLLLGSVVGAGILFAPRLAEETQELAETLPGALTDIERQIRETAFGDWVLDRVLERAARAREEREKEEGKEGGQGGGGGGGEANPQDEQEADEKPKPDIKDAQDAVVDQATGAASRVIEGAVALLIIGFSGLYLAAHPQPYVRGFLRLVPRERRHRIGEVLYACGYTLRWWLYGQLLAMAVVGLLMGVGLAVIGVPLAFALGFVAGVLEFIPTIGPMLGVLPALVLALTQGTDMALWVLGLYTVVQTFEGYLLTPLVQQRVVHLPPVVTISAQVFFAWTVGPLGLLIAVPLVAVVMVCMQMLYVEDFLGDDMKVDAEDRGRLEHEQAAPMEEEDEG